MEINKINQSKQILEDLLKETRDKFVLKLETDLKNIEDNLKVEVDEYQRIRDEVIQRLDIDKEKYNQAEISKLINDALIDFYDSKIASLQINWEAITDKPDIQNIQNQTDKINQTLEKIISKIKEAVNSKKDIEQKISDLSKQIPITHPEKHILESHLDSKLLVELYRLVNGEEVDDLHKHKFPETKQGRNSGLWNPMHFHDDVYYKKEEVTTLIADAVSLENLWDRTGTTLTPHTAGDTVQLSGLTASQILATDASKNLVSLAVATYPSLTELSYIKGLTSAIQTQINSKQATLTNSAGLAAALSDETGTGLAVFSTAPSFTNSATISSTTASPTLNLTNATATDTYDPTLNFQTGASPTTKQSIWLDDSDSDKLKFGLTTGTPALTLGTDGYFLAQIPDNSATAMEIKEATNSYLTFDTTNSAEKMIAGKDFEIGPIQVDADSGAVNFVDMTVSSTPVAGTEESLSIALDGNAILKVYAESDGAGGIQNDKVIIGKNALPTAETLTVRDSMNSVFWENEIVAWENDQVFY